MGRITFRSLALGALVYQATAWGQQGTSTAPQQPSGDILQEVIVTAQIFDPAARLRSFEILSRVRPKT